MKKFINLGIVYLWFAASLSAFKCPSNTTEWCLNIENAKACNIVDQCDKYVWSSRKNANSNLVNITLYYETLCSNSRNFISDDLWKAFNTVSSIMNLTVVPYGNVEESWENKTRVWLFDCQHGDDECWGNLFQSCLIHYHPGVDKHLPIIHCMASNESALDIKKASIICSNKFNINIDPINKCMNSSLGNNLQHDYAMLTDSLNPKHEYVPWITLNGIHNEDIQSRADTDLVKLICDTYQGTETKPDVCKAKC